MSTSVVVSQIAPSDSGSALHVKGTVGGTAFQCSLKNVNNTIPAQIVSGTASAAAAMLLSRYNLYTAGVAILASVTSSFQPQSLAPAVTIAYGSTPVALAGYEVLEITATVAGTSTIAHVSQDDFLEWAGAGNLLAEINALLFAQARLNTQISSGIATFSL